MLRLMIDSINAICAFIIILLNERFIACFSTEVTTHFIRKDRKIPAIDLAAVAHQLALA